MAYKWTVKLKPVFPSADWTEARLRILLRPDSQTHAYKLANQLENWTCTANCLQAGGGVAL
jgi:hypothetical protein